MPILDHLVILLPHAALASPPAWLSAAFTILPGGRHADNLTANTLILLPDGVYIELIAFLPTGPPDNKHPWSRFSAGHIIDFAFSVLPTPSSTSESLFAPIRDRVNASSKITYPAPRPGGRIKEDGTELKWAVSFAEAEPPLTPGTLPFWCLDRTPRELRVPYQIPGNAAHPSGARGVAALDVRVPSREALDVYALIQGAEGRRVDENGAQACDLDVPEDQGGKTELRARVGDEGDKTERIRLTLWTEKGSEARSIGGEIAEGVELWIDLKPLV